MRLGLYLGYSGGQITLPVDMVVEADKLGYDAVWTAEAYGSDAVSPLAWLGALTRRIKLGTSIMQIPARTPAMTAMTAMTLDQLSGGRMILGLGLSGPQVAEGWHGVPYGKPLPRTREYVGILRKIFERKEPLAHQGTYYQIPYQGEDATGLGKPLKSILHGRSDIPIYIAAIGPMNVTLAAEIADGWLPIFFSPERYGQYFEQHVSAGLEKGGRSKDDFAIVPSVTVIVEENLAMAYNQLKPTLALYVGGMGAKGKNFYNDLAVRYGFEEAAETIQDLYLSGQKAEAIAAVPDELVDAVALVGSRARIKDRVQLWLDSPIHGMNVTAFDIETVRFMAELVL